MKSFHLKDIYKLFGLKKLVKYFFAYYLYRFLKLRTHQLYILFAKDNFNSSFSSSKKNSFNLQFKEVSLEALKPFLNDPAYELSEEFLFETAKAGHRCFAAFDNDKLVSYSFFSAASTEIGNGLYLYFPIGWTYVYKVLTLPEYRGLKISAELIKTAYLELKKSNEFQGLVAVIFSDNLPSQQAFKKMGFKLAKNFLVLDRSPKAIHLKSKDFFKSLCFELKQII